ncbi:MAG: VIT family protein [Flavobacteriales bacterium]|nr:VIT family protein [Flavobacteriales bacterium]
MHHNNIEEYFATHYIHKSNWLRASVLGANDGIISIASLAVGVAAAGTEKEPVLLAVVAGLVAGALSMAAGEYVSVSSQTDIEQADIEREKKELEDMPEIELHRLAEIYEERGLKKETALEVARQLTEHNALEAHIRDELGISELNKAKPLQAALASGASFVTGGVLPLLVCWILPVSQLIYGIYISTIFFLILLGVISAKTGGAKAKNAILRISFWGTAAMALSALVGYIFGVNV